MRITSVNTIRADGIRIHDVNITGNTISDIISSLIDKKLIQQSEVFSMHCGDADKWHLVMLNCEEVLTEQITSDAMRAMYANFEIDKVYRTADGYQYPICKDTEDYILHNQV